MTKKNLGFHASAWEEPPGPTPPLTPVAPTLTVLGTQEIQVDWSPPPSDGGSPITDYTIRWREDGGAFTFVSGVSSPHVLTGLSHSTLHRVSVAAENAEGLGNYSTEATATTDVAVEPDTPSNVTLVSKTSDSLTVTWDDYPPTDDGGLPLIQYRVRWRDESATVASDNNVDENTSPPYTITGLLSDHEYDVGVRARNAVGFSTWSVYVPFTTDPSSVTYNILLLTSGASPSALEQTIHDEIEGHSNASETWVVDTRQANVTPDPTGYDAVVFPETGITIANYNGWSNQDVPMLVPENRASAGSEPFYNGTPGGAYSGGEVLSAVSHPILTDAGISSPSTLTSLFSGGTQAFRDDVDFGAGVDLLIRASSTDPERVILAAADDGATMETGTATNKRAAVVSVSEMTTANGSSLLNSIMRWLVGAI